MSIASEISRLQTAKANIKTSIESKGVTVPTATKLDGYPALIGTIQTGTPLPPLTNPAVPANILSGKEAIDGSGAKITGTIPSKTAENITPGTSNKTITAGQYLSGNQTILGDADLVAGNIKEGVNIFGILGTYVGGGGGTVELGSYVGTGTAGPDDPNVLAIPLNMDWVGVAIMAEDYSVAAIMQYITEDYEIVETPTTFYTNRGALSVDGWSSSSVSWYSESWDTFEQFNDNGETYYYCIF